MDKNEIKNFISLFNEFKLSLKKNYKLNKHETKYRKMFKKSISFNKKKNDW